MIIGVAIRCSKTYDVIKLPKPNRHADLFKITMGKFGPVENHSYGKRAIDQGFYDETGRYMNRVMAAQHAADCKQKMIPDLMAKIKKGGAYPKILFSEDLW